MHPYAQEEVIPEGKRLRMKDWLKIRIGNPRYPGLVWLDEEKQIFKIPWKHAALHGWDQNSDGALFRDWAEHTGSCIQNAHPKTLKATFRCALHSLPDVHEDKTMAKKRGDDACRVFRFSMTSSSAPRKRHIRIRNHKKPTVKNLTRNQIHEATQAMNNSTMHYSQSQFAWNYPSRNNTTSSIPNTAFSPPQVPSNGLTNFQQQPNSWVMQGDRVSFPSMTSPNSMRAPTPVSVSSGFEETFKPMHHSLSDPNISPYYQTENNAIFPRGPIVSQSQNTGDAFSSKIQFDEKTFLQSTGQQEPVSPSSTSMSDPGTSPYYIPDVYEYCGQSNSPGAVYSSSFNTQAKEPFFHNTQNSIPSPLNSTTYLSNQSPVPSVISPCPPSSQMGSDFISMGNQQSTVLTECHMIPSGNQSPDYEILNDITKVVEQNSRSPYCSDTMHSTGLPPASVQQAINEFAFVSSTVVQPNADPTISTKGMFMPSVEEEFFFTNHSLCDNGFMGSNYI